MKKKFTIIIVVVFCIILISVIAGKKIMANIESNLNKLVEMKIENTDLSKISDGIYEGSYKAFPISVKVEVIVNSHKITDIKLIKHDNGKGKSAEFILDSVIKAQSLEVDTISGATYSSKVILKAIEDALNNAIIN